MRLELFHSRAAATRFAANCCESWPELHGAAATTRALPTRRVHVDRRSFVHSRRWKGACGPSDDDGDLSPSNIRENLPKLRRRRRRRRRRQRSTSESINYVASTLTDPLRAARSACVPQTCISVGGAHSSTTRKRNCARAVLSRRRLVASLAVATTLVWHSHPLAQTLPESGDNCQTGLMLDSGSSGSSSAVSIGDSAVGSEHKLIVDEESLFLYHRSAYNSRNAGGRNRLCLIIRTGSLIMSHRDRDCSSATSLEARRAHCRANRLIYLSTLR